MNLMLLFYAFFFRLLLFFIEVCNINIIHIDYYTYNIHIIESQKMLNYTCKLYSRLTIIIMNYTNLDLYETKKLENTIYIYIAESNVHTIIYKYIDTDTTFCIYYKQTHTDKQTNNYTIS